MKKVIQCCKREQIAALEMPTGTGKTLSLLCSTLVFLEDNRRKMINEHGRFNNKKQPIIYYASRTNAQITNVINELKKIVYKPVNSVIGSREIICPNPDIEDLYITNRNTICEILKNNMCPYFHTSKTFSISDENDYNNKTIEELKCLG